MEKLYTIFDPVKKAYREIKLTDEQAEAYINSAEKVKKQKEAYDAENE